MNDTTIELPDTIRAVEWTGESLRLLDQRELPHSETYLELQTVEQVAEAISTMVVRGAPAIGIAAAYAVVLALRQALRVGGDWRDVLAGSIPGLLAARPTAVNLHWAVQRMQASLRGAADAESAYRSALGTAAAIHAEDVAANREMGRLGAGVIATRRGAAPIGPCAVLTHCNTGSLATGGFGTALGVIRTAWADGLIEHVFADETRPWLQGARLTAWELVADGIPASLLTEAAAGTLMASGRVEWVIVGADRVAANGDVANKIGTYALAVLARHHGVGFMVVAPTATLDEATPTGASIVIEERDPSEVTHVAGHPVAPAGVRAFNPAFDVTPAALVDALVTERGVVSPAKGEPLAPLFTGASAA